MNVPECAREPEVVAAVVARRWPHGCTDDLAEHVAWCSACGEVAALSVVFDEDRRGSAADLRVPSAAQVWWRAAIRARLEAQQAAARPLRWVHAAAAVCLAGLAASVLPDLTAASALIAAAQTQIVAAALSTAQWVSAVTAAPVGSLMAAALAVCLLVAPIAAFVAMTDE